MLDYILEFVTWISTNYELGIGIFMTILGLLLTISEYRVYSKFESRSDNLIFWLMFLFAGLITVISRDLVLGILFGLSIYLVVETKKMWDTPVWGKLMAASCATYLVILLGRFGQFIYDNFINEENTNDFIFATSVNSAFFVFLGISFYFFGKKFILVSKFSSPQIVYLFLFGIVYVFIAQTFPRDANGLLLSYNYLNLDVTWRKNILFADFGTFEALVIVMVLMYFISGWLLTKLLGVKEITDEKILAKVDLVAKHMGIKEKVKVGYVRAPILNAFAYGPWFDKRVAFISNDIEDFTDDDIKGIIGHELAHAANHHVLILLGLSIAELIIKKAFELPATTLDYTFTPDTAASNVTFVGYYIISYGLTIIILLFVRMLEGHADKCTLEAGYGNELSKALFRLEGFYNGVASDFGISVNLLTDRKYSLEEKKRFTAKAAKGLYGEILKPTRRSAFANVFQSHPRTSYRISSMIDEEMNPIKGAFLSYRLLGFGFRKKAVKKLNSIHNKFKNIIDESYNQDYEEKALESIMQFNSWREVYDEYMGTKVIAFDAIEEKCEVGNFERIILSNNATSPLHGVINGVEFNLARTIIKNFDENEQYILKNGDVVKLLEFDNIEGLNIIIKNHDKKQNIPIKLLGKSVSFITNLISKEVLYYENGVTKLVKLNDIKFGNNLLEGEITLDDKKLKLSDLIFSFSPLGFDIRHDKKEKQKSLLDYLKGKNILLYTKENFDVSLAGKILEVNEDTIQFRDSEGERKILIKELEYVSFVDQTIELINRNQISLFTKFNIWWSNRKEFNYIF